MAHDKLLAEWFWIDRWVGSSAFGLPQEARGVYREMLTQAWRRGAQLPNDHDQIRRLTATTAGEWRRAWPLITRFWRVEHDTLVNDTQLEIYGQAKARMDRASNRGKSGAQARLKQRLSSAQARPELKPPISDLRSPRREEREERAARASLSPPADPFLDQALCDRAARFIERYEQMYPEERSGARYAVKPHRDYQAAVTLCQTWPDARLDKLARCFLTTDHKFAAEGSRTIPQFLALASWCDGELSTWEAAQPVSTR